MNLEKNLISPLLSPYISSCLSLTILYTHTLAGNTPWNIVTARTPRTNKRTAIFGQGINDHCCGADTWRSQTTTTNVPVISKIYCLLSENLPSSSPPPSYTSVCFNFGFFFRDSALIWINLWCIQWVIVRCYCPPLNVSVWLWCGWCGCG